MTMRAVLQDVRFGLRAFARTRGTAVIAIGAIALGTGGSTAIFSAIDGILLRPLPFEAPGQLATITSYDAAREVETGYMSYPDFADIRSRSQTIETVSAWYTRDFAIVTGSGPLHVNVAVVTSTLLPMLGVPPQSGRTFDSAPASDLQTVILSHSTWQQAFGADAGIIGRPVVFNGAPHVVIGVMPPGFRFPIQAKAVDAWTKMEERGGLLAFRKARILSVVGRLKAGVSLEQTQLELSSIAGALSREHPNSNAGVDLRTATLVDAVFGAVRPGLVLLFGAVCLVLLIACATVANLLIAHGAARSREIAVRTAIGATRWRLIRQLLTESMLLAIPGAILGAVLGIMACRLLIALSPVDALRLREIQVDERMLAFTAVLACLTGLLFGLTPALRLARGSPASALQERSGSGHGAHRRRLQGLLVVTQVAVTLVLVVGALLLIMGFRRLAETNIGLETANVVSFKLALPDTYDPPRISAFYSRFQENVAALPGVRSVSTVSPLPLSGDNIAVDFGVSGQATVPGAQPNADMRIVQPAYFRTVGVRVLDGRDFDTRDVATAPPVAIVNAVLAERYFAGRTPLGRKITLRDRPLMVVGVVSSIRHGGPQSPLRPELYLPYRQNPFAEMVAVVKTDQAATGVVRALREAVLAIDPALPIYDIRTLDERLDSSVAQERFTMFLLTLFGGVALFLTVVGLHGVMSQFVRQRTQEIAIRIAFGASRARVLALVLGEGMALVGAGLLLGVVGALALTRFIASRVLDVGPADVGILSAAAALLGGVALLACYRPAARASTIDPMVLLRQDY